MSIKKKFAITIILILAIIALCIPKVNAAVNVGDTRYFGYEDIRIEGGTKWCAEKGQRLWSSEIKYTCVSKIDIEGLKATDHKGNTFSSKKNAIVAYIFSSSNSDDWKQNAGWYYLKTWLRDAGPKMAGIGDNFAAKRYNYVPDLTKAKDYANSLKETEDVQDKTDKSKVKVTSDSNFTDYCVVGPFNFEFGGKLSKITVDSKNGKSISTSSKNNTVKIAKYNDKGKLKELDVNKIKSSDKFYILVPNSAEMDEITKLSVTGKEEVKTLHMVFYKSSQKSWQNLYSTTPGTKEQKYETTFDNYEIPLFGNLKIVKSDFNDGTTLANVIFKIRNSKGEYVVQGSDGKISYAKDESKATEFKTDNNGEIKVEKLLVGSYEIIELKNQNVMYGGTTGDVEADHIYYSKDSNSNKQQVGNDKTISVNIKANSTDYTNIYIYNQKEYGNLKLTKKDFDDGTNLANVTFKLRNSNGEYVVQNSNGEITYSTNANDATEFKTDSNGEITIEHLKLGDYTIIEIKNPMPMYGGETGVVDTSDIYYSKNDGNDKTQLTGNDGVPVKLEANSTDLTNIYIYNKKAYINIGGFVWEDMPGGKDNNYEAYGKDIYAQGDQLVQGINVRLKDKNGNVIQTAVTDQNGAYQFKNIKIKELENYYVEFEYNGLTYTSVNPLVGNDESVNSKAGEVVDQRKKLNSAFTEVTNKDGISNVTQGYTRNGGGQTTGEITYNGTQETTEDGVSYHKSTLNSTTYNNETYSGTNLTANTTVPNYSLKEQYDNKKYVTNNDGTIELKYINLGIYKREQPYIALSKDIANVQVDVNGYSHTYDYAQRNQYVENNTAFNVGVKFANDFTNRYTRAIYPSDVKYSQDPNTADSNKLKVYVTYSIDIANLTSSLSMSANEVVDYCDARYTVTDSWLGDDTNNKITWNTTSKYGQTYSGNGFKAIYTTGLSGTKIAHNDKAPKLYVKFQVSDEAVLDLLNGNKTLYNVAEIYSYSTYYGNDGEGCSAGDIYAGIDRESAPGNATPKMDESKGILDKTTWEADTDGAPSLVLEARGVREIDGTVFEDETAKELQTNQERNGDGIYDASKENRASGVKVDLLSKDGDIATVYPPADDKEGTDVTTAKDGMQATLTTGNDGYYHFRGLEPGEYLVKYTYQNGVTKLFDTNGNEVTDKKVTVQDYKSTVITSNVIKQAFEDNEANKATWYKQNEANRYSDARDDYDQREKIDNGLTTVTNDVKTEMEKSLTDGANYNGPLVTTLWADTPNFEIGVEYDTTTTASTGEAYTYKIQNVDFGIVERARQSATLDKEVSNIKVTLPSGEVLIDGDPRTGNLDNVSIIKDPTTGKVLKINIIMDNELIGSSTLEIKYELKLTNTGEKDYRNQSYYYYGDDKSNPVKLTSTEIMDFVDNEMTLQEGQNGTWTVISNDVLNEIANGGRNQELKYLTETQNFKQLYELLTTQYSSLVIADNLLDNNANSIEPGEYRSTDIIVEKLLATTDELSYDNNGEVVSIGKNGGSSMTTQMGNYAKILAISAEDPSKASGYSLETDETIAPTVVITPPTGESKQYVKYTIIGVASLAVLGGGIYGVRRLLLHK